MRQVPFGLELRIYHNRAFLRSELGRDGRNRRRRARGTESGLASAWGVFTY